MLSVSIEYIMYLVPTLPIQLHVIWFVYIYVTQHVPTLTPITLHVLWYVYYTLHVLTLITHRITICCCDF